MRVTQPFDGRIHLLSASGHCTHHRHRHSRGAASSEFRALGSVTPLVRTGVTMCHRSWPISSLGVTGDSMAHPSAAGAVRLSPWACPGPLRSMSATNERDGRARHWPPASPRSKAFKFRPTRVNARFDACELCGPPLCGWERCKNRRNLLCS